MEHAEGKDRWLVVDTGFGRYLGRLVDGPGFKDGKEADGAKAPFGLTGRQEIVLDRVIRIEVFNIPTRDGIATQAVPSSPVPWLPLFDRDSEVRLALDRIVWYADVSEAVVLDMRRKLLANSGVS